LSALRVHRWSRALRIGNAEEIEDQREYLAQALVQKDIPSGDLFTGGLVGVLLSDTEEAPEQLKHW
jgi:hypothetical protein